MCLCEKMSDFCEKCDTTESSGNDNSAKTKTKYEMPFNLEEKLLNVPEALQYIKLLEKRIKKQRRKLRRFKSKYKLIPEIQDAQTQTEFVEPKSIAEEIKEAAELATQKTGFVYDESSGLYYDSNTGYYYNAEYGLYYDSSSSTYLSYKQDTNTYVFHSRVDVPSHSNNSTQKLTKRKKSRDESKASKRLGRESAQLMETEEGECSISSTNDSSDDCDSSASDVAKTWPPCMRIIVEQSQHQKIKIGSLHILTYEGGTLGREGDHAIILPDINISKCHLRFTFNKETNTYLVTDLGSRNGTVLNGKRMSSSKSESEEMEVAHGSRIQIGSVILLCHVHDGSKTCGHCEPGLIQAPEKKVDPVVKTTKSAQHKHELKKLRKKFGVNFFEEETVKLASGYTDRAQKRRSTVGSSNPHEKTEVASLNEIISSKNKGFKMLEKMGWKEGQSLGKDNQGMVEPVPIISNPGTSGIGHVDATRATSVQLIDTSKQIIWRKTQERFQKLPASGIFEDSD